MKNIVPYIAIISTSLAFGGCEKTESPSNQQTDNSRIVTGLSRASKSDIEKVKRDSTYARNASLQTKINSIAGVYAGDRVIKIGDGQYKIESKNSPLPYVKKVIEDADLNGDGHITSYELNQLEKAILESHSRY